MADSVNPILLEQLKKLQSKYDVMGQDISSYLDGLLYADYLTYWDYIHLDTLLSLQNPKTSFPDEKIFIIYHQITELYFKLILLEIEQIAFNENLTEDFFIARLNRMIQYFRQLESSFAVIVDGMEKDQFLKFRMALLPASGFQSAQYRLIEICSTNIINLTSQSYRESPQQEIKDHIENLYWKRGATELASGKKTLTLRQFEEKYMKIFLETAVRYADRNLLILQQNKFPDSENIKSRLREFDQLANVLWPLAHLKSAGRYLQKDPEDIKATGGTNWQKYLPPRFQKIVFFPNLWSDTEKAEWGKAAFKPELE